MIAYMYDEDFYYVGEAECQIDPLESEIAGKDIWLLPANCTWEKPLPEKEGYKVKWNGENWEYEEIPVPPPPPEPTEDEIKAQMLEIRDEYFARYVDWYQSKHLLWEEMSGEQKDDIKAYREYLKAYNDTEEWWKNPPMTFDEWKEND